LKSPPLVWHRLTWPREAASGAQPVMIETVGSPGKVEHRLALPAVRAASLVDQFRAAIPGVSVEEVSTRETTATHAVELRLSSKRRPLDSDDPASVSRALLTALAHVRRGESLMLQWVLARPVAAAAVPNHLEGLDQESWLGALLVAPFGAPSPVDVEVRNALRAKQGAPGWQGVGRIGVVAASPARARLLVGQVVGALRMSGAPGIRWVVRLTRAEHVTTARVSWLRRLRLNAGELAVVSAFPVGATGELPVAMIGSRAVAPSAAIPRQGRVVGRSSFPGRERPLALSATDSLRHLHVLGPTGVGKSTLLLNLIAQDMASGRAVVVIEPRGDLIDDALERAPPERIDDLVLLDPTDSERPVGLNTLALGGRSPELVADQVLGRFIRCMRRIGGRGRMTFSALRC
jgi:hypothetical protein